jgi:signal transduction histidine kinase
MVLENITDNASKYSPARTTLEVRLAKDANNYTVGVRDEGVGIARADMGKLFKKFSRIDNPLSVDAGGTGLGLYWAKKIMALHKGTVKVSSTPGEGSTFTIILPR